MPMKQLCLMSIALLALNASALAQDKLPARKPGLWEITVVSNGQPPSPGMKQCIDASTDAKLQEQSAQFGQQCEKQEIRQVGQTYVTDSICQLSGSRVISHGVTKGNFSSEYETEVEARYEPPMFGLKETKTKIKARWTGPCEVGQKPGDTVLPNGMKINANTFGKKGASASGS